MGVDDQHVQRLQQAWRQVLSWRIVQQGLHTESVGTFKQQQVLPRVGLALQQQRVAAAQQRIGHSVVAQRQVDAGRDQDLVLSPRIHADAGQTGGTGQTLQRSQPDAAVAQGLQRRLGEGIVADGANQLRVHTVALRGVGLVRTLAAG